MNKPITLALLLILLITSCKKDDHSVEIKLATLTTVTINNISTSKATITSSVGDDGGSEVLERGIVCAKSSKPTIGGEGVAVAKAMDKGAGEFAVVISGLEPGTTYYARSYAVNKKGTSYGAEQSFTTTEEVVVNGITVSTSSAEDITSSTVKLGGTVTTEKTVSERGVVYATTQEPTVGGQGVTKVAMGNGVGDFSATVTELTPNTIYFVRAYAIDNGNVVYGSELSFTTISLVVTDGVSVSTSSVEDITSSTAKLGGAVTTEKTVSERGVVYSKLQNPEIGGQGVVKVDIGSGTGNFSADVTGLNPNTVYYVRAYAIADGVTAYGSELTFTTLEQGVTVSAIEAISVSEITSSKALLTYKITRELDSRHVVVYANDPTPRFNDSHAVQILSEKNSGEYTVELKNLTASTKYYISIFYAIDGGATHTEDIIFTTQPAAGTPSVSTRRITNLTHSSAVVGGEVLELGGSIIADYGVVYSTSPNPLIGKKGVIKRTNGSTNSLGKYTITLQPSHGNFTGNTTYYIKAYAINSAGGLAYGEEREFTTKPPFSGGSGTVSDPYLIATAQQLDNARDYVLKYFKQTANIDLGVFSSGDGWEPLRLIECYYDGGGYTINNLTVNVKDQIYAGLFETQKSVKNLNLTNVNVKGSYLVGGIAAQCDEVLNCSVQGNIFGKSQVGGLVGSAKYIHNSHAIVTIKSADIVGGLVGEINSNSTITNSYAICTIDIDNSYGYSSRIGGIAGQAFRATIERCFSNVNIKSTNNSYSNIVGGIVGMVQGSTIANSYSMGSIDIGGGTNNTKDVGGIVGQISAFLEQNGIISSCYTTCSLVADDNVTGIAQVVFDNVTIKNCAALNAKVVIKPIERNKWNSRVSRITGTYQPPTLIGNIAFNNMVVTNGEGNAIDVSGGAGNNAYGEPKTKAECTSKNTYLGLGWDFDNIWEWGGTLPKLRNVGGQESITTPSHLW